MYVNYIDYSYSTIIIIMIIMEVFNLSVIPKRIDYNTGATEALCFGKFLCWITERD